MRELSLNMLDIAQNSIAAGATLVTLTVDCESAADRLTLTVEDNGRGMPPQLARVRPVFTTRTTRKVGMGIPLCSRMAAEMAGGRLQIRSAPGAGTTVEAVFILSHIDRMPLGDMDGTVTALIRMNPQIDFRYVFTADGRSAQTDTASCGEILGDVPLDTPEVMEWIDGYIRGAIGRHTARRAFDADESRRAGPPTN